MCALFSDDSIRCWRITDDGEAWLLPNLTGTSLYWFNQTTLCAVQRSGRVACMNTDFWDGIPHARSGFAEPVFDVGLEGVAKLDGLVLRSDGRVQRVGFSTDGCVQDHFLDCPCRAIPDAPIAFDGPALEVSQAGATTQDGLALASVPWPRDTADENYYQLVWPPSALPGVEDAVSIKGGIDAAFVLHRSGSITAFGWAPFLGLGLADEYLTSGVIAGIDDAVALESNSYATCAIRGDGSLWCWGSSTSGQFGVLDPILFYAPFRVPGIEGARLVGLGNGYTCVVRDANEVSCWGVRDYHVPASTEPYRIRFY
jgi:hypothetical protein